MLHKNCDKILATSPSFVTEIQKRVEENKEKVIYWPQYAEEFYQPAENNGGAAQLCRHSLASYGERLEHNIQRRHSALVVIRSVVAVRRALDGDLRELFEFAVVEEAVFVSVTVVADAAREVERKPLAAEHAVRREPLIPVLAGLEIPRFVDIGAGGNFF